jgi:hypothetical protein
MRGRQKRGGGGPPNLSDARAKILQSIQADFSSTRSTKAGDAR